MEIVSTNIGNAVNYGWKNVFRNPQEQGKVAKEDNGGSHPNEIGKWLH